MDPARSSPVRRKPSPVPEATHHGQSPSELARALTARERAFITSAVQDGMAPDIAYGLIVSVDTLRCLEVECRHLEYTTLACHFIHAALWGSAFVLLAFVHGQLGSPLLSMLCLMLVALAVLVHACCFDGPLGLYRALEEWRQSYCVRSDAFRARLAPDLYADILARHPWLRRHVYWPKCPD
jgi:hypothetical protein